MNKTLEKIKTMDVAVCFFDELPVGLGRAFQIQDRVIAVFRTRQGSVHAIDNRCPHKAGPLSEGMITAGTVVCPLHAFHFDLLTGECEQPGQCAVMVYPCRVEDQSVIVELPLE